MSNSWLNLQSPVARPNYATSGWDRPRDGGARRHRAMDFRASVGTPVYAIGPGVVVTSIDLTSSNSAGQMIAIEHAGQLHSRYMHLSRRYVRKGDTVLPGQLIALSGKSGIKISAPHLHFGLQLPPSQIANYERLFSRPIGGYKKHSNGNLMVPVEPVIPIDGGSSHVFIDAMRFAMIMRRDRPDVIKAIRVSNALAVRRDPYLAMGFIGVTALVAASIFMYTIRRGI